MVLLPPWASHSKSIKIIYQTQMWNTKLSKNKLNKKKCSVSAIKKAQKPKKKKTLLCENAMPFFFFLS